MANVTINDLPGAPGSAAQDGDEIEIQRGASSYRVLAEWLRTYARAGLTLAWSAITGTPTTRGANTVLAGPATGADAAPTFRALVADDLPAVATRAGALTIRAAEYAAGWAIGAEVGEFAAGYCRTPSLDLTWATEARLTLINAGEFPAAARARVQYSLDNGATWPGALGVGDGPEITGMAAYATRDSGWVALAPAAQAAAVMLRLVGLDGDGTTGYVGNVYVELR